MQLSIYTWLWAGLSFICTQQLWHGVTHQQLFVFPELQLCMNPLSGLKV